MIKNNLYISKTPEELAVHFGEQLMNWVANYSEKAFHLAISGGKTPNLLFSVLAEKYAESPLWQKTHFWWVDERMVPPNHPESNFGVANKLLFSQISIPEENIHRIKGENTPEAEALSYSSQIQERLKQENGWPVFDLILLGMGDDGHTASIFPNQIKLFESTNVCAVAVHPESGQKRVTLTGKVLNNSIHVCFLVTGKTKADRMAEITGKTKDGQRLPAFYVSNANENTQWFLDQDAASKIGSTH